MSSMFCCFFSNRNELRRQSDVDILSKIGMHKKLRIYLTIQQYAWVVQRTECGSEWTTWAHDYAENWHATRLSVDFNLPFCSRSGACVCVCVCAALFIVVAVAECATSALYRHTYTHIMCRTVWIMHIWMNSSYPHTERERHDRHDNNVFRRP